MRKLYTTIGAICAFVLFVNPASVAAEQLSTSGPPPSPFAGLMITEIQPGTAANASEEFIELYNYSDQVITFSPDWYITITSSTATRWINAYRTVGLTGSIAPGEAYVV